MVERPRRRRPWLIGIACALAVLLAGCATTPQDGARSWREAERPAWSYRARHDEMVVAVSPAGRTLRIAGSAGLVVGTMVDAGVNAKYQRVVAELLDGYDTGAVFEERLAAAVTAAMGAEPVRVQPLGTTAGFSSRHDAERARLAGLAREGVDAVMDLQIGYGLYGKEGTLAAVIDGTVRTTPSGKRTWARRIVVTSGPVLASSALGDPTKQALPNPSAGLRVDAASLDAWAQDDGSLLKARFEEAVDEAVAALLVDLGLAEPGSSQEGLGLYALGVLAMREKRFQEAEDLLARAVAQLPADPRPACARAANLAHAGDVEAAAALAKALADAHPEFPAVWANLAWWYALDLDEPDLARECLERAAAIGMPPDERVVEKLAEESPPAEGP